MRRDAEPPAVYTADGRRCRGRDVPRSPATAAVRDPAPIATSVLDAPTPRATDGRESRQEQHLGRANGAYRADDEQRPRPAAFAVTRARRSARSQATTAARTPRSRVGTGFAPAKPVRRLRPSDRRHARRPAPETTQAPEQRVGHRPPRTHQQSPPAGAPRPTPFRNRLSQPVLDSSAKSVPRRRRGQRRKSLLTPATPGSTTWPGSTTRPKPLMTPAVFCERHRQNAEIAIHAETRPRGPSRLTPDVADALVDELRAGADMTAAARAATVGLRTVYDW